MTRIDTLGVRLLYGEGASRTRALVAQPITKTKEFGESLLTSLFFERARPPRILASQKKMPDI